MSKVFESLIEPKKFTVGKRTYHIGKIPVFYAQRVLLRSGEALKSLDLTKLPEDVIMELLSYVAFENSNGEKIVLDDIDMINAGFDSPKDLIEVEMKVIMENFGFFFDGSLAEIFNPLVDLIVKHSGTSTRSAES